MDDFLNACRAAGPLELMVENRGLTAARWSALQPFAFIGRDPSADLYLDHPRVDGRHAYLQVIEGGVFWVDLASQGGTRWVDGNAPFGWLDHLQGIGIGPYVIRRASDGRRDGDRAGEQAARRDPFLARAKDDDGLPRITLEFRRESAQPIRWRMRHLLTLVGSSPHCKVRLSAPGVSPFHCSLLRTVTGAWAVNLLGREGVTLNGSQLRAARLTDGDELKIGDVLIRLLFKTSEPLNGNNGLRAAREPGHSTTIAYPVTPSRELATSRPPSPSVWMDPRREVERFLTERVAVDGEISAPLLALVLDQFGQMQQQFLDQFQQTTLMMFRALGTMHRDQMSELREKLDSLHQISENLQAFRSQVTADIPPDSAPAVHEEVKATSRGPVTTDTLGGNAGDVGRGDSAIRTDAPEAPLADENGVDQIRAKVRSIMDQPSNPSLNVHEWLIGRLAALEDEQRTRWQKILDLVRGR
jgi:pSer/pThr/pTyr-binding forkhead associated (FHA) protein